MKGEEKIIELLTEYIQRTDKMEIEFGNAIRANQKELIELRKESNFLKEESNSLKKDNRASNIRQEAVMQEIFSLSKRVLDLEEE